MEPSLGATSTSPTSATSGDALGGETAAPEQKLVKIKSEQVDEAEINSSELDAHFLTTNLTSLKDGPADRNSSEVKVNQNARSDYPSLNSVAYNEDEELEEGELKSDDEDEEDEELYSAKKNSSPDPQPIIQKDTSTQDKMVVKESSAKPSVTSTRSSSRSSSAREGSHGSGARSPRRILSRRPSSPRPRYPFISSRRVPMRRERENPEEKEALLISMRTKLLEARSRELEMKMRGRQVSRFSVPAKNLATTTISTPKDNSTTKPTTRSRSRSRSRSKPKSLVESKSRSRSRSMSKSKSRQITKSPSPQKPPQDQVKKIEDMQVKTLDDQTFLWPGYLIKETETKPTIQYSVNPWASDDLIRDCLVTKEMLTKPHVNEPLEIDIVSEDKSLQGPKTPPDNHVLALNDEQIEWPSHLIKMTVAKPSLPYSINPSFVWTEDEDKEEKKPSRSKSKKKKHKHKSSQKRRKGTKLKTSSKSNGFSLQTNSKQPLYFTHSRPVSCGTTIEMDFTWYYNYFKQSYDMDHNQALHQAFYAIITAGSYEENALNDWLNSRGLRKENSSDKPGFRHVNSVLSINQAVLNEKFPNFDSSNSLGSPSSIPTIVTKIKKHEAEARNGDVITHSSFESKVDIKKEEGVSNESVNATEIDVKPPDLAGLLREKNIAELIETSDTLVPKPLVLKPIMPRYTIIKSQEEITLPNGKLLPPGTIQTIVHPYPRVESETLSSYFDFF